MKNTQNISIGKKKIFGKFSSFILVTIFSSLFATSSSVFAISSNISLSPSSVIQGGSSNISYTVVGDSLSWVHDAIVIDSPIGYYSVFDDFVRYFGTKTVNVSSGPLSYVGSFAVVGCAYNMSGAMTRTCATKYVTVTSAPSVTCDLGCGGNVDYKIAQFDLEEQTYSCNANEKLTVKRGNWSSAPCGGNLYLSPGAGVISCTVDATCTPPPTVNLYFSFLNSLKTGTSKIISMTTDYFSVGTVFAGK